MTFFADRLKLKNKVRRQWAADKTHRGDSLFLSAALVAVFLSRFCMSEANLQNRGSSPLSYMYFVYVIKNFGDGETYIGYTNNLGRRLKQLKQKFPKDEFIYYEAYLYEKDARNRERKLKQYGSAWRGLKKRINA